MRIVKANNLACPLDGLPLNCSDKQYSCASGHSFDIARQGYINLLPVQHKSSKHPGDSKEMVNARAEFLNSGFYEPIAKKLTGTIADLMAESGHGDICLLDAGCGEGYYLDYLSDRLALNEVDIDISFIGLDISKSAILAAAKRNGHITWLVASNKQVPVLPASVDLILCMFGFPVYESFKRILKPDGKIILVEAGPSHLIELRKLIYPQIRDSKPFDTSVTDQAGFAISEEEQFIYNIELASYNDIMQLMSMTPHLYRASQQGKQKLYNLDEISITVDVVFRTLINKG